jgi:hypothetical protein
MREALDFMYLAMERLHRENRFDAIDGILADLLAHFDAFSLQFHLGVLAATLPRKDIYLTRRYLFDRVESEIQRFGLTAYVDILRGLK